MWYTIHTEVDMKILIVLVIIFLVYITNLILSKIYAGSVKNLTVQHTFVFNLLHFLTLITGVILIVLQFTESGKELRNVFLSSSVVAIILGLAAQSSLNNIFCGFTILSSHPFEIGDRVQIGDNQAGYVKKLAIQTTVLQTYTGEEITIPNAIVASSEITNFSHIEGFSYPLEITVAYGTDLDIATGVIQHVLYNHEKWYGSEPTVLVKEAGDYGIKLKTLVTTRLPDCNPQVCSDCLTDILSEFQKYGIEIPYPTISLTKESSKT